MNEDLDDINISHFKLGTGEDIIAIVLNEDSDDPNEDVDSLLRVQRPMEIKLMIDDDGNGMFMFYDWQPFSNSDTCMINPSHIISVVQCESSIKEEYIAACLEQSSEQLTPNDSTDDPNIPTASGKIIRFPTSNKYH